MASQVNGNAAVSSATPQAAAQTQTATARPVNAPAAPDALEAHPEAQAQTGGVLQFLSGLFQRVLGCVLCAVNCVVGLVNILIGLCRGEELGPLIRTAIHGEERPPTPFEQVRERAFYHLKHPFFTSVIEYPCKITAIIKLSSAEASTQPLTFVHRQQHQTDADYVQKIDDFARRVETDLPANFNLRHIEFGSMSVHQRADGKYNLANIGNNGSGCTTGSTLEGIQNYCRLMSVFEGQNAEGLLPIAITVDAQPAAERRS